METQVKTTPKYWDCECKDEFIHSKAQKHCPKCGAEADEQPDSRVNEVAQLKYRIMRKDVVDGYVKGRAEIARLFFHKENAEEFIRNHRYLRYTDFFYIEPIKNGAKHASTT